MKYLLDKEELENVKTKLLSVVTDFLVDLAKNKSDSIGVDRSGWPSMNMQDRVIYINIDVYKNSVEKLGDKLSETINNL